LRHGLDSPTLCCTTSITISSGGGSDSGGGAAAHKKKNHVHTTAQKECSSSRKVSGLTPSSVLWKCTLVKQVGKATPACTQHNTNVRSWRSPEEEAVDERSRARQVLAAKGRARASVVMVNPKPAAQKQAAGKRGALGDWQCTKTGTQRRATSSERLDNSPTLFRA
jgi:hypothetical protein